MGCCKGVTVNQFYCGQCCRDQGNDGTNNDTKVGMVPVGTIIYAHILQLGYVKANGQLLNRNGYSKLYKYAMENNLILGESDWVNQMQGLFAEGDGTTTFRVPDLRGQFLRCINDGTGMDAARALGSVQGDAIRNIIGEMSGTFITGASGSIYENIDTSGLGPAGVHSQPPWFTGSMLFDASRVVPTAEENRPQNIALIAQIKY